MPAENPPSNPADEIQKLMNAGGGRGVKMRGPQRNSEIAIGKVSPLSRRVKDHHQSLQLTRRQILDRPNVAGILNALFHHCENFSLERQPRECQQNEIPQNADFRILSMLGAAVLIVWHWDHLRSWNGCLLRGREDVVPPTRT